MPKCPVYHLYKYAFIHLQTNIIIYAMKNLNSEYYFLIIDILADFQVQKISLTYLIKLHL